MKKLAHFIIFSFFASSVALSQTKDDRFEAFERQSDIHNSLSKTVSRATITPIVSALKRATIDDPELQKLLSQVEFTTTPHLMRKGNSYASRLKGRDNYVRVELDLAWFNQALSIGLLAATRIIDPNNKRNIMRSVGLDYGKDHSEAIINGSSPSDFVIDITDYVSDPLELSIVQGFGHRITEEVMAWTVLHEVAHHKLGHLTYRGAQLKPKDRELAADKWAHRKMEELGISLFGIMSFMQVLNALDYIHNIGSKGSNNVSSTHATWAQRLAVLNTNHNPVMATTKSIFTTYISKLNLAKQNDQADIQRVIYGFSRDPSDLGCVGIFRAGDNPPDVVSTERRGSSMHLLQATPDLIIDIEIANPDQTISLIVTTVTNRKTGEKYKGSILAWEQSFSLYGELEKEGVRVGEAMQTSKRLVFSTALNSTTGDPNIRSRALAILENNLESTCVIVQEFSKGIIGKKEMLRRNKVASQNYISNLKMLLGNDNFEQLQSNMMASSLVKAGLKHLKRLQNIP